MCLLTTWSCVRSRFKTSASSKCRRFDEPEPKQRDPPEPKACVFRLTVKNCKESLASNHCCRMFEATKCTVSSQPTTITARNMNVRTRASNHDTTQKEQKRSNDCQSGPRPTVYCLQSPSYCYNGMFLRIKETAILCYTKDIKNEISR